MSGSTRSKSTRAAAEYLGDLYGLFGHWFLAQASYNAGESRVGRAIQRARTSDFWALTQTRHLPDETKLFVPQDSRGGGDHAAPTALRLRRARSRRRSPTTRSPPGGRSTSTRSPLAGRLRSRRSAT